MTGYELSRQLITAIGTNAAVQDFCLANFNKPVSFFLGVDESNPPAAENAPFVLIAQQSVTTEGNTAAARSVLIGCVITDSKKEKDDYIEEAYKGFNTIEHFESLVYTAVEEFADPSINEAFSIIEPGEVNFKHYYPYFHAIRIVKISTERT